MAERKEQLKRVNSGGMVLLAALTIADNEGAGGTPSNFGHITGMYTDTKLPAIYFVIVPTYIVPSAKSRATPSKKAKGALYSMISKRNITLASSSPLASIRKVSIIEVNSIVSLQPLYEIICNT